MNPESRAPAIREALEDAILESLKPQPILGREGLILDPDTKEPMKAPPDASYISAARAYLKDVSPSGPTPPATGKPREGGLLDQYSKSKLPFGIRPQ